MPKDLKNILIISATTLIISLLIWLPHLLELTNFYGLNFGEGLNTIYRNYDGIEYIIIAKTFYFPEAISKIPQELPANYFAAHFPGYSILILLLAPLLGFLKSMLFISLFFTAASAVAFYYLVKDFKLTNHPLFLSILFLLLPARWVIVHSVGSSEPVFIFFVIMAIYFFMKFEDSKRASLIWLAGIFGALAQFTRPPGALLAIALGVYILWKIIKPKSLEGSHPELVAGSSHSISKRFIAAIASYYPLLLIPFSLFIVFFWYSISYGDFFAYFKSGDNIHLGIPPYQIFNKTQYWVGDIWLEDVIYIFIIGFSAGVLLFKQKLFPLAFFVLTYFSISTLIAHRDISRYTLPAMPFVLIAFEKFLTSKEFKIVLALVVLGIYLYSQNYILNNTAPYPNLKVFD